MATMTLDLTAENLQSQPAALQVARAGKPVPSGAKEMFFEGLDLLNCGEPEEAVIPLEKALDAAPDFADGHVALGIAYAMVGKIYPAIDHLQKSAELEPENFYAQFKLGQLYFKLRIPDKGYAQSKQALGCANTLAERKLVAELLREERQRASSGLNRPAFTKPFSKLSLAWGALIALACLAALIVHVL
jgi:tetratricopeptide (TPR) repeat protein